MLNPSKKNAPPPALEGNKRALGNQGGAPPTYTEAWLREEARLFYNWMKKEDSLYFKSFAVYRGYNCPYQRRCGGHVSQSKVYLRSQRL